MNFWDLSFWQSLVSNIVATLIGVLGGVYGAIRLNNFQERKTEKERKEKILRSLYEELDYSKATLVGINDKENIKNLSGVISAYLRNEIWNAYSDGGELEWIKDVSLLAQIAEAYYYIRAVSNLADKYYDSVQYATEESSPYRIGQVYDALEVSIEYGRNSIKRTMDRIRALIPDIASNPYKSSGGYLRLS